jgi:GMP synthase (glutamine-hydrolysing)
MSSNSKILIVKTGTTDPLVVEVYGDYDDWFQRSLSKHSIDFHIVKVYEGEPIPDVKDFDGVMITGSPSSVWEDEPWMRLTIEWLKTRIQKQDTPILAVCFGHQLLGAALGGTVVPNKKGPEFGTVGVQLSSDGLQDRLFDGMPSIIEVYSVHKDVVIDVPSRRDARCLGSTDNTNLQVLAVDDQIRSVQFHPEILEPALSKLFHSRGLKAEVYCSVHGIQILENWVRYWILGN